MIIIFVMEYVMESILVTCNLTARSSAVRFLEFMRAWPHCGQSVRWWLQLSQSR